MIDRSARLKQCIRTIVGALMLTASAAAFAQEFKKGDLVVDHARTRATAGGQKVAAGYLELRNRGKEADRIIGASTPAAERIELHVVLMEGQVMKMREVKSFEVPAGGKIEFRPGGPHLMIMGIKRAFKKDERIPVMLRFENAGEVAIELAVEAIDARPAHKH
jgi:hypothetical protein